MQHIFWAVRFLPAQNVDDHVSHPSRRLHVPKALAFAWQLVDFGFARSLQSKAFMKTQCGSLWLSPATHYHSPSYHLN